MPMLGPFKYHRSGINHCLLLHFVRILAFPHIQPVCPALPHATTGYSTSTSTSAVQPAHQASSLHSKTTLLLRQRPAVDFRVC